jgi:hypothetical protein
MKELSELNKKEIDDFYERYKSKILNNNQNKLVNNYKEQIYDISLLEIKLNRIKQFDFDNQEMKNDYENYINQVKTILEQDISKFSNSNKRNMMVLKYYLSVKVYSLLKKLQIQRDIPYFMDKVNNLNVLIHRIRRQNINWIL